MMRMMDMQHTAGMKTTIGKKKKKRKKKTVKLAQMSMGLQNSIMRWSTLGQWWKTDRLQKF